MTTKLLKWSHRCLKIKEVRRHSNSDFPTSVMGYTHHFSDDSYQIFNYSGELKLSKLIRTVSVLVGGVDK